MNGTYAERVWDYLRSLGFTPQAAAGIIGNMVAECGTPNTTDLNPTAIGYTPYFSYGLCQWTAAFGTGSYRGSDIWYASFEDQLRFLNNTMQGAMEARCSGSYNRLKNATNIQQATHDFQWCYEYGGSGTDWQRYQNAIIAYNKFKNRPLWTPTPPAGGGATGNWIFPLTYYTGCQCRRGEVYVGATDLAAPNGTEIHAIDGGIVDISWIWQGGIAGNNSYGNFVRIDHGNGWKSLYAHMNSAPLVSYGQSVSQGTLLGYVGHTGNSDGDHLHLEVISSDGVRHCASEVFGMYCPWT